MEGLAALENLDGYRRLFADPLFWAPYVKQVCQKHALKPDGPPRIGVPGTCPAFIAGERWVVKFFGRLFEGGKAFRVEKEAARLAALDPGVRAVPVLASGELVDGPGGEGWPWPYLVYPYIPGGSLGEAAGQVSPAGWLALAAELGHMLRRLHALPLAGSSVFPNHLDEYRRFLEAQRAACLRSQRGWGSLPARLLAQVESFLPPIDELVPPGSRACLIHADLTRDHLLGYAQDGRWNTRALIDFGDAMTGSLPYELAALHLDLFRGERRLLAAFLDAYGLEPAARRALPRRAMAAALLHPFNLLEMLPDDLRQSETLDDLTAALWQA